MKKLKNIYSVYLLLYFVLYFPLLMQFFTNTKKFLIVYFFTSSILILLYLFINFKLVSLKKIFIRIYFIIIYLFIILLVVIKFIFIPKMGYNLCTNSRTIFHKYCEGAVLGNKKTGSVFDPQVLKIKNEYYMYVSTRENGSISLSKSDDGINWSKLQVVLSPEKNSWDAVVNRANVIIVDNKYYMYYTGQSFDKSSIGLAISNDGITFEKMQNDAIIIPTFDYEKNNVMNPYVLFDEENKIFRMYYSAGEMYEPDVIAYAESKDGINWSKKDEPIIKKGFSGKYDGYKVGGCEVHKTQSNKYIMFYIGYTDIDTARILYAISDDGINFKAPENNLILESTKFYFDSSAVYKPTVVFEEKDIKLWYNGRYGDNERIGYAICKDCNL